LVNFKLNRTTTYNLDKDTLEKDIVEYVFDEHLKKESKILDDLDSLDGTEENFQEFVDKLQAIVVPLEQRTIASIVNDESYNLKNRLINDYSNKEANYSPIIPSLLNYSIKDLEAPNLLKRVSGFGSFSEFRKPTGDDIDEAKLVGELSSLLELSVLQDKVYTRLGKLLLDAIEVGLEEAKGQFTEEAFFKGEKFILEIDLEEKAQVLREQGIAEVVRLDTDTEKVKAVASLEGKGELNQAAKELFSDEIKSGNIAGEMFSTEFNRLDLDAGVLAKIILLMMPSVLDLDISNNLKLTLDFTSKGARQLIGEKSHDFITDGVKNLVQQVKSVKVRQAVEDLKEDILITYKELSLVNKNRKDGLLNDEDLKEAKRLYKELNSLDTQWKDRQRIPMAEAEAKGIKNRIIKPKKFMSAGFTSAIEIGVIGDVEAKNEVIIEIINEYTELKFTQLANLKATKRKIEGNTQIIGRATPTERPLKYGKTVKIGEKTRIETEEEYAKRMASYGLPHLRLIGDNLPKQQIFVSDFISDILGNFDDLEEELAELKEKVI
jgi:hypothetical protein